MSPRMLTYLEAEFSEAALQWFLYDVATRFNKPLLFPRWLHNFYYLLTKNKLYSKIISIKIGTSKILWFSWLVELSQEEEAGSSWEACERSLKYQKWGEGRGVTGAGPQFKGGKCRQCIAAH